MNIRCNKIKIIYDVFSIDNDINEHHSLLGRKFGRAGSDFSGALASLLVAFGMNM